MKDRPLITIAITTYDRKTLLIETINSIICQKFSDYEILIGNDNTNRVVDKEYLGISNNRITYVNNEKNLGEWDNIKNLFQMSKGAYFTAIADDDLYASNFFELVADAINKFNNPKCVGTSFTENINEFNCLTERNINGYVLSCKDLFEKYLYQKIKILGIGIVINKEMFESIGGFGDWHTSAYADTYIAFKIITNFNNIIYIDEPLMYYRDHDESLSSMKIEVDLWIQAQEEFVSKMEELIIIYYPKQLNKYLYQIYKTWCLSSITSRMIKFRITPTKAYIKKYITFGSRFRGISQYNVLFYLHFVYSIIKVTACALNFKLKLALRGV